MIILCQVLSVLLKNINIYYIPEYLKIQLWARDNFSGSYRCCHMDNRSFTDNFKPAALDSRNPVSSITFIMPSNVYKVYNLENMMFHDREHQQQNSSIEKGR